MNAPRADQAGAGDDAYRVAGVDIAAGNRLVARLRELAAQASRPEVEGDLGGFAGLFRWPGPGGAGFLAAGADGVGTKVELARQVAARHPERAAAIYRDLGQDLVAMCANDVLCAGAAPLFFLDYVAAGKLDPDQVADLVGGVAGACREAGAALLGGETAEMPGVYVDGRFDLAGFCVGWVEAGRAEALRAGPRPGDIAVGLASSGLHSNGFSLVRKILNDVDTTGGILDSTPHGGRETLEETLLRPTRLYVRPVLEALGRFRIGGLAHITGGGLVDNPPRALRGGQTLALHASAWPEPPVFGWLREAGRLDTDGMRRTFNLGLGMILYVAPEEGDALRQFFIERGLPAYRVGRVEAAGDGSRAPEVAFT